MPVTCCRWKTGPAWPHCLLKLSVLQRQTQEDCHCPPQEKSMGVIHLGLAVFFLLSSPVHAQWWKIFLPNPKTTTVSPAVTSPTITSPEPSDPQEMAASETEDKVSVKFMEGTQLKETVLALIAYSSGMTDSAYSTVESWTPPPEENSGEGNQSKPKYKPLKHWIIGESFQDVADFFFPSVYLM